MRFVGLAAALLALLLAGLPARAEPYHLRIGWVVVPADLIPLMFLKPGLAPHAGKTYIPELTHFNGTPSEMTALATGDLDLAALAYSTFAFSIENAGMSDLRVIADTFQDGVPGYHTNEFMVRNDSPIYRVEDLKGKVLATNQTGSAVNIAMRAMLAKHNLTSRDVTIIEVRFPDQKAMLKEKKVDLIPAVEPFGFDPELRAFAHTLFTQKQAVGRTEMIIQVARAGFIAKHRAAVVDFLEDYLHVLHYLTDPAHHDEAVKLVTGLTKQKPSLYQSWLFTKQDYYRDPNGLPDLKALQATVDLEKQLGFLRSPLEVDKYADLSLVKEAAGRLLEGSASKE
ncbi:MAG TPA: ABC transporter substrate-binding protein [Stellaceae bacterium]|nr:ABC transporter substrate-binding protein [Stellaceae bacterium]